MPTSPETNAPGPVPALGLSELPWISWALLIACGILVLRPLSVTWSYDPDYSFGWFIPFIALFLFSERWAARPPRAGNAAEIRLVPLLGLVGLPFLCLRLAAEADPDWRPGLWLMVGIYVGALLGWLACYGGRPWVRHFAFPVCFLFLGLPWPFQIEYPLVQSLMRLNTVLVADSLHGIDIPAQAVGNIIRLPKCELGVEEACSGILSLQASLMMGFLLGEIYSLAFRRRIFLVVASLAFALIGNYGRTLFLALIAASDGVQSVAEWHDTAGFSILVFTAVSVWLASLFLRTPGTPTVASPPPPTDGKNHERQTRIARRLALAFFMMTLLAEALTQAWFGWRESTMVRHPQWLVNLPRSDAFKEIVVPDVTRQALECDFSKTGQWRDEQGWEWTLFWFGYKPKAYNKITVGWHNPDKCLPSVGLTKDRDYPSFSISVNGLDLAVQPRKFLMQETPVYVFWLVYPVSGSLPPVVDNQPGATFAAKVRSHLRDVWEGNRGIGVETLEVVVTGPPSYEEVRTSYIALLKNGIMPGPAIDRLASEKTR